MVRDGRSDRGIQPQAKVVRRMSEIVEADFRQIKPYYHVPDARLSEGITYVNETKTLLWVDIYKGEVHKVEHIRNPETSHDYVEIGLDNYRANAAIKYPYPGSAKESIGAVFPLVDEEESDRINRVLFACKYGIGKASFASKEWEYIALYRDCPDLPEDRALRLRSNDGNVSPCGRYLYVGLMNDFDRPLKDEGCLVRVRLSDRRVEMVWDRIKIPNAIHWNEKGDTMYFTESLEYTIWQYNENTKEKKPLIDIKHANNQSFESPEPDGSAIDLLNHRLYVCVYSTAKVQEFSLKDGSLLKEYLLPPYTPRVTSCAIAGNDLYVTTANEDVEHGPQGCNDGRGGSIYKLPNVVQVATQSALLEFVSSKRQPIFN
ncbi:hypothetical protein HG536_0C03320 [Torulaspora globosa]|uniref:SMP-30/Gluconolactonase/LRE-like region domain-containing protein n=1 Tax=Torulaspora globosa TaxID=48254 RepID=A0A7G3ZF77_9SACH|nr:uncharacterized protein HG536_0C03320 [Torulaspora globosa]QLL32163.1 hypothetical protein HG536_0C03320 [Torulaspora globosa]